MKYVTLNLDHPRIGCGVRDFFVVAEGRTKARLFYLPTCTSIEVDKRDLAKAQEIVGYSPKAAARRLRGRLRDRKRWKLQTSGADAKAVLADLEAA